MRRLMLAAVLMLVATTGQAQSGMTWQLLVFANGTDPVAGLPFYTLTLPASIVTCNATQVLPPPPAAPPVNPKNLWWTQDELPGQVCHADLSGQTEFIAMPVSGPYPLALTAFNETGTPSPRGVGETPFKRVDPATRPLTVRLVK